MKPSDPQFNRFAVNTIKPIEDAYCWEGGATARVDKAEGDTIELVVSGSSTVEHNGDVDGIRCNVRDLRGQNLDGFVVKSATIETQSDRHGDEDFTVNVKGRVILKKAPA